MRILFLSAIYPWPLDTGGAQRVHHVIAALAERHAVTLVAFPPAGTPIVRSPLEARCARVEIVEREGGSRHDDRLVAKLRKLISGPLRITSIASPESRRLVRVLRALKRCAAFDAVWATQMWLAEIAEAAGFRRIIVDIDDMPSVILERSLATAERAPTLLERLNVLRVAFLERLLPRRFHRLVVAKPEDLPRGRAARRRAFVVPNGLEPSRPLNGREAEHELLFVGHLFHRPNVDAITSFLRYVFPEIRRRVPDVTFRIVGKGENPEVLALDGHDGVRVASSVPDLEPYYERASVVVAPLRQGSGTKLKVLEGLARGKAIVATTVGAEGIGLRPGVDIEVEDDPGKFAAACVRLLGDGERRVRLGLSGRERVQSRFSWQRVHAAVERVVSEEPSHNHDDNDNHNQSHDRDPFDQ